MSQALGTSCLCVAFDHTQAKEKMRDALPYFIDRADHFEWRKDDIRVLTFAPSCHILYFMLLQEFYGMGVTFTAFTGDEGGVQ